MTAVKKYTLEGKEVGSVEVPDALANATCSSQGAKDYIVALRANARQWSANTKGRSEVAHSTKKPHAQKGGGRSRQGSLVAPQYRGGGRVFGPKPKFDQHVRINRRERQQVMAALVGEKVRGDAVAILDNPVLKEPCTKTLSNCLNLITAKKRVLVLLDGPNPSLQKSVRNIPRVQCTQATSISGYDLMLANNVICTEGAFHALTNWLSPQEAA